ncbi:hypothetical protein JKP88DRAFT_322757 [Tribonema minus]|uniref:Uncharacterized protein n=1 Tax=Tribonema minus TaxID=303371 RepID=A0A835YTB9_9STRA|nr:hypothetical protein JKP88DRAFT_322757 [Tribonema minus]
MAIPESPSPVSQRAAESGDEREGGAAPGGGDASEAAAAAASPGPGPPRDPELARPPSPSPRDHPASRALRRSPPASPRAAHRRAADEREAGAAATRTPPSRPPGRGGWSADVTCSLLTAVAETAAEIAATLRSGDDPAAAGVRAADGVVASAIRKRDGLRVQLRESEEGVVAAEAAARLARDAAAAQERHEVQRVEEARRCLEGAAAELRARPAERAAAEPGHVAPEDAPGIERVVGSGETATAAPPRIRADPPRVDGDATVPAPAGADGRKAPRRETSADSDGGSDERDGDGQDGPPTKRSRTDPATRSPGDPRDAAPAAASMAALIASTAAAAAAAAATAPTAIASTAAATAAATVTVTAPTSIGAAAPTPPTAPPRRFRPEEDAPKLDRQGVLTARGPEDPVATALTLARDGAFAGRVDADLLRAASEPLPSSSFEEPPDKATAVAADVMLFNGDKCRAGGRFIFRITDDERSLAASRALLEWCCARAGVAAGVRALDRFLLKTRPSGADCPAQPFHRNFRGPGEGLTLFVARRKECSWIVRRSARSAPVKLLIPAGHFLLVEGGALLAGGAGREEADGAEALCVVAAVEGGPLPPSPPVTWALDAGVQGAGRGLLPPPPPRVGGRARRARGHGHTASRIAGACEGTVFRLRVGTAPRSCASALGARRASSRHHRRLGGYGGLRKAKAAARDADDESGGGAPRRGRTPHPNDLADARHAKWVEAGLAFRAERKAAVQEHNEAVAAAEAAQLDAGLRGIRESRDIMDARVETAQDAVNACQAQLAAAEKELRDLKALRDLSRTFDERLRRAEKAVRTAHQNIQAWRELGEEMAREDRALREEDFARAYEDAFEDRAGELAASEASANAAAAGVDAGAQAAASAAADAAAQEAKAREAAATAPKQRLLPPGEMPGDEDLGASGAGDGDDTEPDGEEGEEEDDDEKAKRVNVEMEDEEATEDEGEEGWESDADADADADADLRTRRAPSTPRARLPRPCAGPPKKRRRQSEPAAAAAAASASAASPPPASPTPAPRRFRPEDDAPKLDRQGVLTARGPEDPVAKAMTLARDGAFVGQVDADVLSAAEEALPSSSFEEPPDKAAAVAADVMLFNGDKCRAGGRFIFRIADDEYSRATSRALLERCCARAGVAAGVRALDRFYLTTRPSGADCPAQPFHRNFRGPGGLTLFVACRKKCSWIVRRSAEDAPVKLLVPAGHFLLIDGGMLLAGGAGKEEADGAAAICVVAAVEGGPLPASPPVTWYRPPYNKHNDVESFRPDSGAQRPWSVANRVEAKARDPRLRTSARAGGGGAPCGSARPDSGNRGRGRGRFGAEAGPHSKANSPSVPGDAGGGPAGPCPDHSLQCEEEEPAHSGSHSQERSGHGGGDGERVQGIARALRPAPPACRKEGEEGNGREERGVRIPARPYRESAQSCIRTIPSVSRSLWVSP